MKNKLLLFVATLLTQAVFSQAPTIAGDVLLCPNATGTASVTNGQTYDSYKWYWKYWFTGDPFVEISGANGSSFTYDWATYDQALLKVVVTLGGNTYESNTIQIDSYAWTGLTVGFENSPNVSVDPNNGNVLLCQGTSFTLQTYMPYNLVKWYKNGELIAGANSMQLEVTQPGSYYVVAAPDFCPDSTSSTQGLEVIVVIDTSCGLGLPDSGQQSFTFYPNPVHDVLNFDAANPIDRTEVFNLTGEKLYEGSGQVIDFSGMSSGVYLLRATLNGRTEVRKIVKR